MFFKIIGPGDRARTIYGFTMLSGDIHPDTTAIVSLHIEDTWEQWQTDEIGETQNQANNALQRCHSVQSLIDFLVDAGHCERHHVTDWIIGDIDHATRDHHLTENDIFDTIHQNF